VIDVIDTGPAFRRQVERIFQAYYTTKKGGTGIGLAMARRIADEHGGESASAATSAKARDFWIALPIK
jgi:signal transduction histidine kinase